MFMVSIFNQLGFKETLKIVIFSFDGTYFMKMFEIVIKKFILLEISYQFYEKHDSLKYKFDLIKSMI